MDGPGTNATEERGQFLSKLITLQTSLESIPNAEQISQAVEELEDVAFAVNVSEAIDMVSDLLWSVPSPLSAAPNSTQFLFLQRRLRSTAGELNLNNLQQSIDTLDQNIAALERFSGLFFNALGKVS